MLQFSIIALIISILSAVCLAIEFKDIHLDDSWKHINCTKTFADFSTDGKIDTMTYLIVSYSTRSSGNICCWITNNLIFSPFPENDENQKIHCMNALETDYINHYPLVSNFAAPQYLLHGTTSLNISELETDIESTQGALWAIPGIPDDKYPNNVIRSRFKIKWPYFYADPYLHVLKIPDVDNCYGTSPDLHHVEIKRFKHFLPEEDLNRSKVFERLGYVNGKHTFHGGSREIPDAIVYTKSAFQRCKPEIVGTYMKMPSTIRINYY